MKTVKPIVNNQNMPLKNAKMILKKQYKVNHNNLKHHHRNQNQKVMQIMNIHPLNHQSKIVHL